MVLLFLFAFLMNITYSLSHVQIIPEKSSLMGNGSSHVSALYVMGDSSVDCGNSTPLYPYIHRNLSLLPCNSSDTTLLPYLLGTFSCCLFAFLSFLCSFSWNIVCTSLFYLKYWNSLNWCLHFMKIHSSFRKSLIFFNWDQIIHSKLSETDD